MKERLNRRQVLDRQLGLLCCNGLKLLDGSLGLLGAKDIRRHNLEHGVQVALCGFESVEGNKISTKADQKMFVSDLC
jgi:hypothetical protein